MNKYIVAYINFFDNVLEQVKVFADTDVDAAVKFLINYHEYVADNATMEEIKEACFNADCMISVYQI